MIGDLLQESPRVPEDIKNIVKRDRELAESKQTFSQEFRSIYDKDHFFLSSTFIDNFDICLLEDAYRFNDENWAKFLSRRRIGNKESLLEDVRYLQDLNENFLESPTGKFIFLAEYRNLTRVGGYGITHDELVNDEIWEKNDPPKYWREGEKRHTLHRRLNAWNYISKKAFKWFREKVKKDYLKINYELMTCQDRDIIPLDNEVIVVEEVMQVESFQQLYFEIAEKRGHKVRSLFALKSKTYSSGDFKTELGENIKNRIDVFEGQTLFLDFNDVSILGTSGQPLPVDFLKKNLKLKLEKIIESNGKIDSLQVSICGLSQSDHAPSFNLLRTRFTNKDNDWCEQFPIRSSPAITSASLLGSTFMENIIIHSNLLQNMKQPGRGYVIASRVSFSNQLKMLHPPEDEEEMAKMYHTNMLCINLMEFLKLRKQENNNKNIPKGSYIRIDGLFVQKQQNITKTVDESTVALTKKKSPIKK